MDAIFDREVAALMKAHTLDATRAADYLIKVKRISAEGFTNITFADKQRLLTELDKEYGITNKGGSK